MKKGLFSSRIAAAMVALASIFALPAFARLDTSATESGTLSKDEHYDEWCFYKIDKILCQSWSDDKNFIKTHPQLLRNIDVVRPTAYGTGYEGFVHEPGYFREHPQAPDHPTKPLGARMQSIFDLLNSQEHLPNPNDFIKTIKQEEPLQKKVTDCFIDYQSLSPQSEEDDRKYLVSIAGEKLINEYDSEILRHQIQYLENGWYITQKRHLQKLMLERASRIDFYKAQKAAQELEKNLRKEKSEQHTWIHNELDGEYGDWYDKFHQPIHGLKSALPEEAMLISIINLSPINSVFLKYLKAEPDERTQQHAFLTLCGLTEPEILALDWQIELKKKELSVLKSLQSRDESDLQETGEESIARAQLKKFRYLLNNWNIDFAKRYYLAAGKHNPHLERQLKAASTIEPIPRTYEYPGKNEVLAAIGVSYRVLSDKLDAGTIESRPDPIAGLAEFTDRVEDYVFSSHERRRRKLGKLKALGLSNTEIERFKQDLQERDWKLALYAKELGVNQN